MSILQVSVSEKDLKKFGLEKTNISFEELLEKISAELARQALQSCQEIAERVGLSKLSPEDIDAEIKALRRQHAKPDS